MHVHAFARRIRELFPGCPASREFEIAAHACRKYSGRLGRCSAAKALDADAVRLAVAAHIRHAETKYDDLLLKGLDRFDARSQVRDKVEEIIERWEGTPS